MVRALLVYKFISTGSIKVYGDGKSIFQDRFSNPGPRTLLVTWEPVVLNPEIRLVLKFLIHDHSSPHQLRPWVDLPGTWGSSDHGYFLIQNHPCPHQLRSWVGPGIHLILNISNPGPRTVQVPTNWGPVLVYNSLGMVNEEGGESLLNRRWGGRTLGIRQGLVISLGQLANIDILRYNTDIVDVLG